MDKTLNIFRTNNRVVLFTNIAVFITKKRKIQIKLRVLINKNLI
jgi:hypothetical protein